MHLQIDTFCVVSPLAGIIFSSDQRRSDVLRGHAMQLLKVKIFGIHNSRDVLPSVTGVTMLAASALLVTACGSANSKAPATAPASIPVDPVRVRQDNVPLRGDWVGTLDGFVNAQIQPQVSGYLVQQNYREGFLAAKDQVLFQIDRRQFQATVGQAAAQVEQAKGQLSTQSRYRTTSIQPARSEGNRPRWANSSHTQSERRVV